jgi:hypothetical protein
MYIGTGDLDMTNHTILFNTGFGLRGAGGGEVKTGPLGQTFQFFAGNASADIARFKDQTDGLKLAVDNKGGIHFTGGQKVCSAFIESTTDQRLFLLVSADWTLSDCAQFRDVVRPGGKYQAFCIFDTKDGPNNGRFSVGVPNAGPPTRNCGW